MINNYAIKMALRMMVIMAMMTTICGLPIILKLFRDRVEIFLKEAIDKGRFVLYRALDRIPLSQVMKSFQHVQALLDSGDGLKGTCDDVLHHHFQIS